MNTGTMNTGTMNTGTMNTGTMNTGTMSTGTMNTGTHGLRATRRRSRTAVPALVGLLLFGAAACGGTDSSTDPPETTENPTTQPGDDGGSDPGWDDFASDTAREEAKGLLGMNEADLPADVRISRRGDEYMMLTEDYVLGRLTVALDDDGDGFRVTEVIVELPDGPATFELQPG